MVRKSKKLHRKPLPSYPIDQQAEHLYRAEIDVINKWRPVLRKEKLAEILRDSNDGYAQLQILVDDKLNNLNELKEKILESWKFTVDTQSETVAKYKVLKDAKQLWIEDAIKQTVIECDSIHHKTAETLKMLEHQCHTRLSAIEIEYENQEVEMIQKLELSRLSYDQELLNRKAELSREIVREKFRLDQSVTQLQRELEAKRLQSDQEVQPLIKLKRDRQKELSKLNGNLKKLSKEQSLEKDTLGTQSYIEDLMLKKELLQRKKELEQNIVETKAYWLAKIKQISVEFDDADKELNKQIKMADKALAVANNQVIRRAPVQHHYIQKWSQTDSQKLIMLPLLA